MHVLQRTGLLVILVTTLVEVKIATAARPGPQSEKTPVIFDTDIGEDIDDLWALVYLLRSPEMDVKLITTGFTLPMRKATIAAKALDRIGRTDVPVGAGVGRRDYNTNYRPWADDFQRENYKGTIYEDAVGKLIDTVHADKTGRLKIVAVGPMQTVAEALRRDPSIAEKAELVAMAGRFRYPDEADKKRGESNVRCKIPEAQRVFSAPWKKIWIAPWGPSRRVHLYDERYRHVLNSDDAGAKTIIEVYKIWQDNINWAWHDTDKESSNLYDTMAVHMAWNTEPFEISPLKMRVTEEGLTVIDQKRGSPAHMAMEWKSDFALRKFKNELVRRIAGSLPETGVRLGVAGATASVNQEQARQLLPSGELHRQDKAWKAERTDKQPQWFQLELERPAEVRMLKIAFGFGARWPEEIEILTSRDGDGWQSAWEGSNKTKESGFKRFPIKPTEAKFLRVVVKGHGTWHSTLVKGVRVYGLREGG